MEELERLLLRICRRHLPLDEAEEAAREAIVELFRHRDRLAAMPPGDRIRYTARIARNKCFDRLRRWIPAEEADDEVLAAIRPQPDPSAPAELADERLMVLRKLRRLPARARRLIWRRYFKKWSLEELASGEGCTVKAVSKRLSRAMGKLGDLF